MSRRRSGWVGALTEGTFAVSLAAADFSQVPMSQHLAATLARASDAAGGWGASEVSLEHVLLALCDDPDAEAVLTASRVDVPRLKSETVGYLNSQPRQNAGGTLGVAPALSRILEAAAAAATSTAQSYWRRLLVTAKAWRPRSFKFKA